MVCHALHIIDDCGIDIERFRTLHAESGGFEVDLLLYVFHPKTILSGTNYQLASCFPEIHDASYGDKFLDFAGPDEFTTLSFRVF